MLREQQGVARFRPPLGSLALWALQNKIKTQALNTDTTSKPKPLRALALMAQNGAQTGALSTSFLSEEQRAALDAALKAKAAGTRNPERQTLFADRAREQGALMLMAMP